MWLLKLLFVIYHINIVFGDIGTIPKGWSEGEKCNRVCIERKTMKCFFHFKLENIVSMSKACYNCPNVTEDCYRQDCIMGGGVSRPLMVVNRQLPGPPIEVCKGDKVRVVVENRLINGESTTMHWHGIRMNENNEAYMDGVPFVTQCPILSGTSFAYEYTANVAGTYFYHSHEKVQRGEGDFGPLIVRAPEKEDPHNELYDYDLSEHVIIMFDWSDSNRFELFQKFLMGPIPKLVTTGFLINGYGYANDNADRKLPFANFTVKQGSRYRFRLISSGFADCPYVVSIDNHNLTIIATDGHDVQPINVTSLTMQGGERYDFVLNANQPNATYWIRVKGLISCIHKKVVATALLSYEGASNNLPEVPRPNYEEAILPGINLNPMEDIYNSSSTVTIDRLRSIYPTNSKIKGTPKTQIYLSFELNLIDSPHANREGYYGIEQVAPNFQRQITQINHISFEPVVPPLLQNHFWNKENQFCNSDNIDKNCTTKYCACPHVVSANKGDLVEIILYEPDNQNLIPAKHPVHVHGYSFYVLGVGRIGRNVTLEKIKSMDKNLRRNFDQPPLKDTVFLSTGGYVILRFIADNPGFWLIHCHVEYHAEEGMQLVLKVGNHLQMPHAPRKFPECDNFSNS